MQKPMPRRIELSRPQRLHVIPVVLMLAVNAMAFNGTRLFNQALPAHSMATALDAAIPFVPAMIIVYILAYVQWGYGFLTVARSPRRTCWYYASAMILAKLVCTACFLVYPTVMAGRPMPEGTDLISRLTAAVFRLDAAANNLFPSIHCLDSWFFLRVVLASPQTPRWVKPANVVFTLAVFASVVLVKQHVLVDVPAGIAVAELCLRLVRPLFRERPNILQEN